MRSPLVTVVIPAYNEAPRIGRAIDSLAEQTHTNIEVIVVNDGSTDDTGRVVQENYPQVIYTEQKNAGPGAARNTGARLASGELLAFLDADDCSAPDKIAKQVEVLRQHPEWQVVGTNALIHDRGHVYPFNNPHRPRLIEHDLHNLIWGYEPHPASIVLPTELFREVGGYDASLRIRGEDEDLLYRLAGAGHRVVELNELLHLVTRKATSLVNRSLPEGGTYYLKALENCLPFVGDGEGAPLTPRQYSFAMGDRVYRLVAACFREGERELGRAYAERLRGLPSPAVAHRLLHRLARMPWPIFGLAANIYQGCRRGVQTCQAWGGVTGALRQVSRRYIVTTHRRGRAGDRSTP